MEHDITGWTFTDGDEVPWQELGSGVEMKSLGMANDRLMAMFRFAPGYIGSVHDHGDAEFTYVLEGDLIANGVEMQAGHSYAAEAKTKHTGFESPSGSTVISVFQVPG